MILILNPTTTQDTTEYKALITHLQQLEGVTHRVHQVVGDQQVLTEIYLIGNTSALSLEHMQEMAGVERAIRISDAFRVLGRHKDDARASAFTYNGVTFSQDNLHVFAGLCAVDNPVNVERMFQTLQQHGQVCARMGAYKPRTNPYSFQGHGAECLPWVFELAGKYGIKVIAMEITHDRHITEIEQALEATGNPTGVMLQIGTRNTQNFELLKHVGRQTRFPVLIKRGFGITLEESLNAAEYLASEGNSSVIFALRGMKTNLGDPHRNFVDFSHVPVVKRMTRMPVCVDPSHSVGIRTRAPDGIPDLVHATAQGVIAGANMVLVDFHPEPARALVDGAQALTLDEMPWFLEDIRITREAYEKRVKATQAELERHGRAMAELDKVK